MTTEQKIIGIYRILNTVTNKSYVGSSLNIGRRFLQHKYLLRLNKSHSPKLQSSYNKHGVDSFTYEIVEVCADIDVPARELYWIERFDSLDNGYNCSKDTLCATRGLKRSAEQAYGAVSALPLVT